jgi:hypothetical protein
MPDELRRLGKREAYQLGSLRTQGVPQGSPPRLFTPSFLPRHRGPLSAWVLSGLAGVGAIAGGAQIGLWFVPFIVGVLAGFAMFVGRWRLRVTLASAAAMAVIGWGVPLGLAARGGEPEGATARVVAALLGIPPHAVVGVAVTLLIAAVQALVGAWLGVALAPRALR